MSHAIKPTVGDLYDCILQQCIAFKEQILQLDNDHLMLMALIIFVFILSIKVRLPFCKTF